MPIVIEYLRGGSYAAITLDAADVERYEASAQVTEHPVERGANVSDHVRPNPDTFSCSGWISNAPIVAPPDQPSGAMRPAEIKVGGRTVKVTTFSWATPFDRIRSTDTIFSALIHNGELLRVTTGLRTLEDLVLVRYSVDRDAAQGGALPVTLDFKQVRLVNTARAAPVLRRARPRPQRGAQGAPEANRGSVLHQAGSDIAGLARRALGGS